MNSEKPFFLTSSMWWFLISERTRAAWYRSRSSFDCVINTDRPFSSNDLPTHQCRRGRQGSSAEPWVGAGRSGGDGQPRELGGMKVTNIRPTVKPDIAPAKQMQTNDAKRYPQKSVVPG